MEVTFDGGKVITAHINGHIIRTDQPEKIGGTNTAPTPFDLFLAAIGTCAGIYVKLFCDMRKIPTEGIKIVQNADYNQETGLPTNIQIEIQLPESFPEKYINAVVNVAEQCKVKNTIKSQPKITVNASKI
jgi:ribosomal protein S12 methylthiotransferase accessory factor